MARCSHKRKRWIPYNITHNVTIQYDPQVLRRMYEPYVVSYKLQLYTDAP